MPYFSELDPSKALTDTHGAASLITQHSGALGHSMIAFEYLRGSTVENVVAHLVALPSTNVGKPTQLELTGGRQSGGGRLKARILIQREGTLKSKIAGKLNCTSKTWSVLNTKINNALMLISIDASLSDTRSANNRDTNASDYQTSPYEYALVGKLRPASGVEFGINCANWAVSVLEEAGVSGVRSHLVDIPARLTSGGNSIHRI